LAEIDEQSTQDQKGCNPKGQSQGSQCQIGGICTCLKRRRPRCMHTYCEQDKNNWPHGENEKAMDWFG